MLGLVGRVGTRVVGLLALYATRLGGLVPDPRNREVRARVARTMLGSARQCWENGRGRMIRD